MPDENTAQDAPTVPTRYTDSQASPQAAESASVPQDGALREFAAGIAAPPRALLTRDAILEAPDRAIVEVEVPEWGGNVLVRSLSGAERDSFEASCMVEKRDGTSEFSAQNMRAKLVALCLVDANGLRIFQKDDVKALGRKSAKALARVFDKATELNGLSDRDVKSLEGNSDGQDDGSSSDSPWPLDEQ